jgi:hypothetical protein
MTKQSGELSPVGVRSVCIINQKPAIPLCLQFLAVLLLGLL